MYMKKLLEYLKIRHSNIDWDIGVDDYSPKHWYIISHSVDYEFSLEFIDRYKWDMMLLDYLGSNKFITEDILHNILSTRKDIISLCMVALRKNRYFNFQGCIKFRLLYGKYFT